MQVDQWGKVRVRPHTVGSWACHVYLTAVAPPEGWKEATQAGLDRLRELLPDVRLEETLHISLSKTFYAKHWQLEPLIGRLKDRLVECSLGRVTFVQWTTYENEEGTRSFLALDCQEEPWLPSLVKVVDSVLAGYGFAPFYQVLSVERWALFLASVNTPHLDSSLSCQYLLGIRSIYQSGLPRGAWTTDRGHYGLTCKPQFTRTIHQLWRW